jgi:hypothetical protein
VLKTSKSTVGRAVEIGEQIGLWRRDPEHAEGANGEDILHMRLELQPAYDDPRQAVTVERKQHGGARPGAGRKPRCKACPPGTVHRQMTERTVTYFCPVHGEIGSEVLPPEYEDYLPESGVQEEVDSLVPNSPPEAAPVLEIQDETGSTPAQRPTENQKYLTIGDPQPEPPKRRPSSDYADAVRYWASRDLEKAWRIVNANPDLDWTPELGILAAAQPAGQTVLA